MSWWHRSRNFDVGFKVGRAMTISPEDFVERLEVADLDVPDFRETVSVHFPLGTFPQLYRESDIYRAEPRDYKPGYATWGPPIYKDTRQQEADNIPLKSDDRFRGRHFQVPANPDALTAHSRYYYPLKRVAWIRNGRHKPQITVEQLQS